jgi:hypothetical protein
VLGSVSASQGVAGWALLYLERTLKTCGVKRRPSVAVAVAVAVAVVAPVVLAALVSWNDAVAVISARKRGLEHRGQLTKLIEP